MMLIRNMLLGHSAMFQPFRSPDDGSGSGSGDQGGGDATTTTNNAAGGSPTGDGDASGGQAGGAAAGTTSQNDGGDAGDQGGDAGGSGDKPDWKDKQIDRQHKRLKERERELAAKDEELARLRQELEARLAGGGSGGDAGGQGGSQGGNAAGTNGDPIRSQYRTQAEFDAAVQRAAEERLSQTQQAAAMRDVEKRGPEEYGAAKWNVAINRLAQLGGFDQETMGMVMATDDPAKVIFELGSNPDKYQEVMDLPLGPKRTAALIKLGIPEKKAPQVSKAPPPVDGLGRNANVNMEGDLTGKDPKEDELPEDVWRAKRMAHKQKSAGRPWSPKRVA